MTVVEAHLGRVTACALAILAIFAAQTTHAAGGGAGSGGAGAQRAINSGLPPGEAGPPGSPNNRGPRAAQPAPAKGAPTSGPSSPTQTAPTPTPH